MQPSYIGIIGLIILEGSMDIPVDCHIHNPPLGIRNPSQAAQHKALLQCRDLVIMKELTGAIFVGLGGFFCWCPKNPGIRTKERASIYNPILGIGFGPSILRKSGGVWILWGGSCWRINKNERKTVYTWNLKFFGGKQI